MQDNNIEDGDKKNNMPKSVTTNARSDETSIHLNTEPDATRRSNKNREVYSLKRANCRCKFRLSHILNIMIAIAVLVIVAVIELGYFPNTQQGFICGDISISHQYRGDTITPVTLFVVNTLVPLFFFFFVEFSRLDLDNKNVKFLIWRWVKEFLVGLFVTLLITEICKVVVGEPRPHFLDTCSPDTAKGCTPGMFVATYECTNTDVSAFTVLDSTRSFPSGHSSISMYVALFCAGYIHFRMHARKWGSLMKPFLISLVLLWGVCCALSRMVDHRHHWWDVLAGGTLGVLGAVYTIVVLCLRFRLTSNKPTLECASTTTLFDVKNRDATSVII